MKLRARDVMQQSVRSVRADTGLAAPDTAIEEVARCLIEHSIHRVPVVDEDERLVGIITTTDLVRLLADERVEA